MYAKLKDILKLFSLRTFSEVDLSTGDLHEEHNQTVNNGSEMLLKAVIWSAPQFCNST